jgi:hypothetical protein
VTAPTITDAELEELNDYERGFVDGVCLYAWWKDGTLYVGTTGRTYAQAIDDFLRERGRR